VLADSRDLPAGLAGLARLVAGPWADWCVLDLLAEGGAVRRVAAAHARPGRAGLVGSLPGTYPLRPGGAGLPAVLRGGKPEVHPQAGSAVAEGLGLDDRGRRVVAELGCASALIVPLVAHGRTAGALSLVWAEPGRRYGPEDVPLFGDVGHRAALAADNARLVAEARLAVRRRDEFLALLAHELRNPLAPTLNAAEILRQCGVSDPLVVKARDVVERQGQVMRRLLDDLLDLSRVTRGRIGLRKSALDLRAALAEAVQAVRPLAEGKGHELSLEVPDEPLAVEADPDRLQQVLGNLLNNAAKYTPPGGRVRVSRTRLGGEVVVAVKDTGVGLAPEMLAAVFEPFVQGETTPDRAQSGLGVGLTLVKSLVAMHGGSVEAHSEGPGKGSEFVVRLPASGSAPAPAPARPPAGGGGAGWCWWRTTRTCGR
jgi:signal transduction histidine kinase